MRARPIYVMVKPEDRDLAALLDLPRNRRSAELLHMTLLPLGDLLREPNLVARIAAMMRDVAAPSFHVNFDRIVEGPRTVSLRGSENMVGAHAMHGCLTAHLSARGWRPDQPYVFHPHITLDYRPDGQGTQVLDAISWRVTHLLLVESIVGASRHVIHHRWPLRPRDRE